MDKKDFGRKKRKVIKKISKFFEKTKFVFIGLVFIIFGISLLTSISEFQITFDNIINNAEFVSYPDFIQMMEDGKVDIVEYRSDNVHMVFSLFNEETKNMNFDELKEYEYQLSDYRVTDYPRSENFREDMLLYNVRLIVAPETYKDYFSLIFRSALPVFIIMIVWIVILLRIQKYQISGFSAEDVIQTSDVTFDQIIGHEEIMDEFKFIVTLIRDGVGDKSLNVKPPKGILLSGPPGTGKTMIAKAIAHEADVSFISSSGADFKELYVGNGARRVRQLFNIARDNAPCILFIDELDAIGESRSSNAVGSEDRQTINAILKEMDGFSQREQIFILGATNFPEKLDPALKRSGRFDREIVILPPKNWKVRKALFESYLKDRAVSDDVDLDTLSRTIPGFTGADIATICNEAAIVAMSSGKHQIHHEDIEEAIDMKIFKGARSKDRGEKTDKKIVAFHEAGHAVMSIICGLPVARASIAATTSGVGGAVFREDSDSVFITKDEMNKQMMVAYAGRASEDIKFSSITTGARNDIQQATEILIDYIDKYGFDVEESGIINKESFGNIVDDKYEICRARAISKEIYNETRKVLKKNFSMVETLANKLLEIESMTGSQINEFLSEFEIVQ